MSRGARLRRAGPHWARAVEYWRTLHSDPGARFDLVVTLNAQDVKPQVTWGTSPEMVLAIDARVPDPDQEKDANRRDAIEKALAYMGLQPNTAIEDIRIDKCLSVLAPIPASKTCAPPPMWCAANIAPRTCGWRWWCRAPVW